MIIDPVPTAIDPALFGDVPVYLGDLAAYRIAAATSAGVTMQMVTGFDDVDTAAVLAWVENDPHHDRPGLGDGSAALRDFEHALFALALAGWCTPKRVAAWVRQEVDGG